MIYLNRAPVSQGLRGCVLRVGVIGINFRTADLTLRESVARAAQKLAGEKGIFFQHSTVLLSTCNRTEIYFHADDLTEAHSDLLALLRGSIDASFDHRLYSYFGIDCFAHLCRVAAGLDSAIVAETEIQRQVKTSYLAATHLPSCLHYIFQKALKVGKTIRSREHLQGNAPTLFTTLWQIGGQNPEKKWRAKRILFVGYSETNRGFASFLSHKGVRDFSFITANPSAIEGGLAPVYSRSELSRWQNYDWIISATRSEEYLIEGTSKREHLIFDLSVPRTVDPEIGKCPNIQLFNIEQINQIIEQKRSSQAHDVEKCEEAVWDHVVRLARIYRQKTEATPSDFHVLLKT